MEYIDSHSHILYGLDDGAGTLDESRRMLELARATGTSAIAATPHPNAKYRFDSALVDQRIAELDGHSGIAIHRVTCKTMRSGTRSRQRTGRIRAPVTQAAPVVSILALKTPKKTGRSRQARCRA